MLYKVEVRTERGALLTLPMEDISDGFIIEEIQGLDPVKATIVSSGFAQLDGEQYQSSRREKRNIIIKLALAPDFVDTTMQGLRNTLYNFFMTKSVVKLRFYSVDQPVMAIEGRVESFDAPKFAKDPTATISILCLDPDFTNTALQTFSGTTVGSTLETTIQYDDTVDTGFLFKLLVNRTMSDFTIYHRPPNASLRSLEFTSITPLVAGDVVNINTQPGNKYATLSHSGSSASVLYSVSPQASWPSLYPGGNKLRIFAEGVGVPYTIEYTEKFGGL
jgi:hypothetical protein